MIERIRARDFSLLRRLDVQFELGLTIVTGASGAGKTLIFDAVGFALGARTQRGLLAKGATSCEVTLELKLDDQVAAQFKAPWKAGRNTIKRRLSASGRSRLLLNDQPMPSGQVQEAAGRLIEITGQFESGVLFNSRSHLTLLDAFGEKKLQKLSADYDKSYLQLTELSAKLSALKESAAAREQEIDFLRYQANELAKANVMVGERDEVGSRLKLAQNSEQIVAAAVAASASLGGDEESQGAYDLIASAQQNIIELNKLLEGTLEAGIDPEEAAEQASALLEGAKELAMQCRQLAQDVHYDPSEVERLTTRLDELHKLERKYDCHADELPTLLESKRKRLDLLTDESSSPDKLETELVAVKAEVSQLAQELSKLRVKVAKRLERDAAQYLAQLDFPQVELRVDHHIREQPGPQGLDEVEFLVSLNPGEPARPLTQVASGGEASRLLLGIKAALAERLGHRVLMLDEVEAGIGGRTAENVARVLEELAQHRQVIAITHLPIVAAKGRQHLVARKVVEGSKSLVQIESVAGDKRREELVRMLGGTGTKEEYSLIAQMLT